MAPLPVIEYLDILKHRRLGIRVRLKILQIDSCSFSGMEEALRYRVVPTVALAAHTGLYAVLR